MLQKIILAFIFGILLEYYLNTDLYFLGALLLLFAILYVLYIIKDINIKDINSYKRHMSFIAILVIFLFGVFYTKHEMNKNRAEVLGSGFYRIEGKIVSLESKITYKELVLRPEIIENLTSSSNESLHTDYIKILVSPDKEIKLFDKVVMVSDIGTPNEETLLEGGGIVGRNEYEEIFYDTKNIVSFPKTFEVTDSEPSFHETLILAVFNFKKSLLNNVSLNLHEPYASIARGITYGDTANLTSEVKDTFKTSGLIHILVLSGTNVSFLILIVYFLLKKFKPKTRVVGTILFTILFILTTGLQPPGIRAGLMISFAILAEYFGRLDDMLQGLLLSLFIILLINPLTLINNTSLHLSFLATFAVFIFSKILSSYLEKYLSKKLSFVLGILISLIIFLDPYLFTLNQNLPLTGNILTFFVEPFIFVSMLLTLSISLINFVFPSLAFLLGIILTLILKIIYGIAVFGESITPTFNFHVSVVYIKIYYVLLFTLTFWLMKRGSRSKI